MPPSGKLRISLATTCIRPGEDQSGMVRGNVSHSVVDCFICVQLGRDVLSSAKLGIRSLGPCFVLLLCLSASEAVVDWELKDLSDALDIRRDLDDLCAD